MITNRSVRSNSSRRSSIMNGKVYKEVPRVQIFLDAHLNRAINKIKAQVSDQKLSSQKSQHLSRDQQPVEQQFKLLNQQKKHTRKLSDISQKITLMPNQVVLKYVEQVYQKYGIKNPLEGYFEQKPKKQVQYLNFQKYPSFSDKKQQFINEKTFTNNRTLSIRTHKKQKKISQNQAKILLLKNRFKNQIQDSLYEQQSTIKKINNLKDQQQIIQPDQQTYASNHFIHMAKHSQGNITYIDHLTRLMQSRQQDTYDFQNDTTVYNTGTMQEDSTPQRSIKNIQKFQEENSINSLQQGESPYVIKPKKKLFVKTKQRAISTNYPSQLTTPENHNHNNNNHNNKVSFKLFQGENSHKMFERQFKPQDSIKTIKIDQSQCQLFTSLHNFTNLNYANKSKLPPASIKTISLNKNINIQPQTQTNNQQISQIYRYCLGCQKAILDSNIVHHQKRCDLVKRLYELPLSELQQIIEQKIQSLRKGIYNSQLFRLDSEGIERVKYKTSSLLNKGDSQNNTQKKYKQFHQLQYLLNNKLLSGCQLIKKLQWFIKVKDNLRESIKNSTQGYVQE